MRDLAAFVLRRFNVWSVDAAQAVADPLSIQDESVAWLIGMNGPKAIQMSMGTGAGRMAG